jgi:hypothetical protein
VGSAACSRGRSRRPPARWGSGATLADDVAAQGLLEAFASRVEQRVQEGGVHELVAELADCDRLAA